MSDKTRINAATLKSITDGDEIIVGNTTYRGRNPQYVDTSLVASRNGIVPANASWRKVSKGIPFVRVATS